MNRAGQFVGQHVVDQTLTGQARQAVEAVAVHGHAEMRIAAGAISGMALVQLGIIDDFQGAGGEGAAQLAGNCSFHLIGLR